MRQRNFVINDTQMKCVASGAVPIETFSVRLNYQIYGSGFPLIILHGLFGSLDNWQTISKLFAEHFQVFALDLRNHGGSPHSDLVGYHAMAEDLREFMETHQLAKGHVLGHSMGGKVAMEFALSQPEKVEKLIVADIAPRAYPPWHTEIFEALLGLDLSRFKSRREVDMALAGSMPETGLRQFLLKSLGADANGGLKWKINLGGLFRGYEQLAGGIANGRRFEGPTLFIRGERSDYVQDADVPLVRSLFPKAEVSTLAGAGHWLHAEKPKEFVERVVKFLL